MTLERYYHCFEGLACLIEADPFFSYYRSKYLLAYSYHQS
jgi:hypothetical protein